MPRYIKAEALIDDLLDLAEANKGTYHEEGFKNAITVVEMQPTADVVERKKGKWIDDKGLYMCSCCKRLWPELWWTAYCPMDRMYKTMPFCPNCGAQMDEEEPEITEEDWHRDEWRDEWDERREDG